MLSKPAINQKKHNQSNIVGFFDNYFVKIKNTMLKLNLNFLLITINLFALPTTSVYLYLYTNPSAKDANIAQFPYQVSLRRAKTKVHFCGGAVLNESVIITAAHCMNDFAKNVSNATIKAIDFFIVAGQTELKLHDKSITRDIKAYTRHPSYKVSTDFMFDVALLELKEKLPPFSTTKLIQPIKLSDKKIFSYINCTVTGWGQLAYEQKMDSEVQVKRKSSKTLKKHNFRTLTWEACKNSYSSITELKSIFFNTKAFCTDSIRGTEETVEQKHCEPADDSGGPLACNGLLTGIVSYGTFCHIENNPGVYFDVQANLDWIKGIDDDNDDEARGRERSFSPKRFSLNYLCLLLFVIAYAIQF